jgi:hypothetical protein
MGLEGEVINNLTTAQFNDIILNNLHELPPQIIEPLSPLINIFKTLGIIAIIYFVYSILSGLFKLRDTRRMKRLEQKIDFLLGKKGLERFNKINKEKIT